MCGGVIVVQAGIQLPEELDVTVEPVAAESPRWQPGAANSVPFLDHSIESPATARPARGKTATIREPSHKQDNGHR